MSQILQKQRKQICARNPTVKGLQAPPKQPATLDLVGLGIPLSPVWMSPLPSFIIHVSDDGGIDIITGLFHIQQSVIIVGNFAKCHEAPDFPLSQLLFLALDWPRRQADAALVKFAGNQDRLSADQQVITCEVVSPSQRRGWHAIPQRQRLDSVVVMVQEMESVV